MKKGFELTKSTVYLEISFFCFDTMTVLTYVNDSWYECRKTISRGNKTFITSINVVKKLLSCILLTFWMIIEYENLWKWKNFSNDGNKIDFKVMEIGRAIKV